MEINEDLPFELQKLKSDEIIKENAVEKLATLLVDAVDERVDDKVAIAFSGGIDSSLIAFICDKLEKDFTLYTVGFADSKDVLAAQTLADEMDWPIKVKIITMDEVEDIIKEVIKITGRRDPITVGVGCVTYSVLKIAKEDIVLTGLGSEEIFAGYERHKGEDINARCWEGMLNIYERDCKRDLALAEHFEKKVRLPFMDRDVIEFGMKIEPRLKIYPDKKQVLRDAAVCLGFKKEYAYRKKSAAQYGSKFDFAIEKLAKKNKMNKKEYLESL
jgi:asparagine synthase (glutamine-hydrolysing)